MSVIKKSSQSAARKNTRTKTITKAKIVVSDAVGNYEHDPYFVKKAASAKAFLERVGLPKGFVPKTS